MIGLERSSRDYANDTTISFAKIEAIDHVLSVQIALT